MAFLWLKNLFKGKDKTLTLSSPFYPSDKKVRSFTYSFNIDDFKKDSDVYSDTLARISLAKAMASYNGDGPYESRDRHIRAFHQTLGFTHIESNKYYQSKPQYNSVGIQIGYRFIRKGLVKMSLLSVAIRSGHYEREWDSNFRFGLEGHHEGFLEAAKMAYLFLLEYIEKHQLNRYRQMKIWISGYSRGGAVTNLLAAKLKSIASNLEDTIFDAPPLPLKKKAKLEIYAYTFESPSPAIIVKPIKGFEGIFNIFSSSDVVCFTPFNFMGFTRYGTSLEINAHFGNVKTFEQYLPDFELKRFCVKALSKLSIQEAEQQTSAAEFIQEMLRFFEKDMHLTRKDYVEKYQFGLSKIVAFYKAGGAKGLTLGGLSKLKLFAMLTSSSIFTKELHSFIRKSDYEISDEDIAKMGQSLYRLLIDTMKYDRSYKLMHLITLKESGGAMFQYHCAELIYAYMNEHPLKKESVDEH